MIAAKSRRQARHFLAADHNRFSTTTPKDHPLLRGMSGCGSSCVNGGEKGIAWDGQSYHRFGSGVAGERQWLRWSAPSGYGPFFR
jgi:hypothetical protein